MDAAMQHVIPIFKGEAYGFWKIKLKTILEAKKLWDVVENGITTSNVRDDGEPITAARPSEATILKDKMALHILQCAVSDAIFPRIAPASSAQEAWMLLETEFQGSNQVRMIKLQTLRREYECLKMGEDDSINTFTNKLMEISNQLRLHGEVKSDYHLVQKILISLPERFDSIVTVLEQTKDLSALSMTELIGTLKAHEKRVEVRNESTSEGAFYTRMKKGKYVSKMSNKMKSKPPKRIERWCDICKKKSHDEKSCWRKMNNGEIPKIEKGGIRCFTCGKPGHFSKYCKTKAHEGANVSLEQGNDDQEEEERHMLFSAIHEESSPRNFDNTWLIDSGCSNHMSKDLSIFTSLDQSKKIMVKVGNGQDVIAVGKGDIQVTTKHGTHTIREVLFVPALARNLLSVAQMISNGYRLVFENDYCMIQDQRRKEIMEVKMKNKSFPIKWNENKEVAFVTMEDDQSKKWHRRLGHVNFDKIKEMQRLKIVENLPKFSISKEVCDACEKGKQSRKNFPKKSLSTTKEALELVHSDVCGPMQTPSLNGNKYFLLFIDDFTRMSWVYFMKRKDEVLGKFKTFKAFVEKQTGKYIKKLRTDGGGEYLSKEFKKLCQEDGIHKQMTTPYSPQQNGVAERRNRTIMEMARSMLFDQSMPNSFWAEAVATSVYIQNILPSKALKEDVTPFELWSGKKPNIEHLRVFGCLCYVQIPIEKRRKLDEKASRGILIGYSLESKGYRIYMVEEERVQVSRDVTFDENKTWCWEKNEIKMSAPSKVIMDISNTSADHQLDLDDQIEDVTGSLSQLRITSDVEDNQTDNEEVGPRGVRSINALIQQTANLSEEAFIHETCMMLAEEPSTFEEASKLEDWKKAMKEEISMIEKNNTWRLVNKPKDKNIISVKWIFKVKTNANGEVVKHKARLVARGFTQEYGIDYIETFAPVSRHDTIRMLLALAAQKKWTLYQMDVKSAFLNGELREEVYIQQPPGFIREGEEEKVLRLNKALYGLKQAPRAWYRRIDAYFVKHNFTRSMNDAALYVKRKMEDVLLVSLYVDDLIITGNNIKMIEEFKHDMKNEFEMTDLGSLNYFLGLEITQDNEGIFLSQEKYCIKLLEKFGMSNCKSTRTPLIPHGKHIEDEDDEPFEDLTTYRSMVGGLMYLCASRPDLTYASSYLARYMSSPKKKHFKEAKRVMRYIQGTKVLGLRFKNVLDPQLVGYSDSDWAGSIEDKKSTSGYVFTIGSAVFSWQSSKQKIVAQSTAEAEYISLCFAANQAIWLQRLIKEMGFKTEEGVTILCDNMSAIAIGKNPVQHKRTKHIDIKYHFVREAVQEGLIRLEHCSGEIQLADILTKPLTGSRFEELREKIGVTSKMMKHDSRGSIEN